MMNTLFRIFMILILLLVIGSILYFGLTRNDNDDVVTPVEEEKLNLSSGIVKSLYSYVENDYRCSNTLAVEEEFNKNVSVIDYDTKFMMAVSIMLDSDRDKLFCNDYEPSLFFKTDINSNYGCGDNYYNENTKRFIDKNFVEFKDIDVEPAYITKSISFSLFGCNFYKICIED